MPYFVRSQGRVAGPVEMDRLQELALKGQLSRSHEISEDRKTWKTAHSIPEIFASKNEVAAASLAIAVSRRQPTEDQSKSGAGEKSGSNFSEQAREWSYALDGAQLGPVTLSDLQTLIQYGSLAREDLVWKASMTQWAPASHVPELVPLFHKSQQQAATPSTDKPPKNKLAAILLALFLGGFGMHHFYLGNILRGILMLMLTIAEIYLALEMDGRFVTGVSWITLTALIALLEAIIMGCLSQASFDWNWCRLGMQFVRLEKADSGLTLE